jgi:hypothetical protein
MKIIGKVWKSETDKFWLAEIPSLDLMVQAARKKEIPDMVKDAVELLIDDSAFSATVTMIDDFVFLDANDTKKLIALILKRQRQKKHLNLEEVASHLQARSINEYAQYEQGRHLPSFEKFEQLLKAIDPELTFFMSLK